MRIKTITNQHRRDFTAVYECEECHHEQKGYGYDDRTFHDEVIPEMKCGNCGKRRLDMDINPPPTATKYQEWEVV